MWICVLILEAFSFHVEMAPSRLNYIYSIFSVLVEAIDSYCLLLAMQLEIQLKQVYLQEALDHLCNLHLL